MHFHPCPDYESHHCCHFKQSESRSSPKGQGIPHEIWVWKYHRAGTKVNKTMETVFMEIQLPLGHHPDQFEKLLPMMLVSCFNLNYFLSKIPVLSLAVACGTIYTLLQLPPLFRHHRYVIYYHHIYFYIISTMMCGRRELIDFHDTGTFVCPLNEC